MSMWPFFTFYGGKWRSAPHYPLPSYNVIVEPFAGSAGYSVRHFERNIVLIDKDPILVKLWRFLISATPGDIRNLPLLKNDDTLDDFSLSDGEKYLIGFWLNKGTASPCKTPGSWMRSGIRPNSFWGEIIRERIANQVNNIKHWKIIEGDYTDSPAITATWFIDPPYQQAGKLYKHSSKDIDFEHLANWCKQQYGQIIACENEGASYLPFIPFKETKSTEGKRGKGKSKEIIWIRDR